jgi:hypothetical protein
MYLEHSHYQRAISYIKLRFFVYSPKDQVHINVQQNKNVLMTIIPNIQWFSFTYFVQHTGAPDITCQKKSCNRWRTHTQKLFLIKVLSFSR